LLFDLLNVDNTLKLVTVVNCPPFLRLKYGSPIELVNKSTWTEERGIVTFSCVELIQVVIKIHEKAKEAK